MISTWHAVGISAFPLFRNSEWTPNNHNPSLDQSESTDHGKILRVLVLDDETVIAETVVEILKHEGFEAQAVPNGSAAIELAATWMPNVVLSDVVMPGINGIETGIKIREMIPDCKIILFSGQAATVDMLERAREQGHNFDVLAKPIRPEQLVSIIRSGFGRSS
jgi:CheY-like chemotaxis protein